MRGWVEMIVSREAAKIKSFLRKLGSIPACNQDGVCPSWCVCLFVVSVLVCFVLVYVVVHCVLVFRVFSHE